MRKDIYCNGKGHAVKATASRGYKLEIDSDFLLGKNTLRMSSIQGGESLAMEKLAEQ